MSITARSIIGKNVRAIRKKLGLSLLNFSILTDLSKATIVNIENGRNGYNLNLLDNILNFTKYHLKEITNNDFKPKDEIRDKLINLYAKNDQFYTILNSTPEISYAFNNKILNSTFLDTPKEIKEIRDYLKLFNWNYKGTSISTALKRMPDLIKIEPHPTKKGTFVYSKR